MLEYLTEFLPISDDDAMTRAMNLRAVEGWSMSRFEPEMGRIETPLPADLNAEERRATGRIVKNVPGYRVVWVQNHGPVEGEAGPEHAHTHIQAVPFEQLPPHIKSLLEALNATAPGYKPTAHKPE